MSEFTIDYDAIINLAALQAPALKASIKDGEAIFEEYEWIRKAELLSSLIMTHIATAPRKLPEPDKHTGVIPDITASDSFLAPDGYICYNGSMAVYDPTCVERIEEKKRQKEVESLTILNKIAGCVQMKQALDLSNDRQEEDVIWAGATVNTLVWDQLLFEKEWKNRKLKKAHDRKLK